MTKISKNIFRITLIMFLLMQYLIFLSNSNKTISVFNQINSNINNYNYYLINFKNELNTKNFNQKFSILKTNDYEIKKLYVDINETWNNNLKDELKEYSFDNLNNFISNYIKNLNEYNMSDEIINVDRSGIRINKVMIYTNKNNINILKEKYNNIAYKKIN